MLHFFIRIHDGLAIGIIGVTDRQRKAQFSPGGGIFLAADHTGVKKMEFCFSHGTFQADEETVIKI